MQSNSNEHLSAVFKISWRLLSGFQIRDILSILMTILYICTYTSCIPVFHTWYLLCSLHHKQYLNKLLK